MASQLNADPRVSTGFATWDSYETISPGGYTDEDSYVRACLEEIADAGEASPGDCWLFVDSFWKFGYGGTYSGSYTLSSGGRIWGARVAYSPMHPLLEDPLETHWNLAIHEMAHLMGGNHNDGCFAGSSDGIYDVTPMATAYVRDRSGDSDTTWDGSGTVPDRFDCSSENSYPSQQNHSYSGYCGRPDDACRHTVTMSGSTIKDIESATPI